MGKPFARDKNRFVKGGIIMANLLSVSEVAVLKGMDDTQRPLYFSVISTARKVPQADVEKAYADLLGKADERIKADTAKVENERKLKLVDTLRTDTEAFTVGQEGIDWDSLEELRERGSELGVAISFAGLTDGGPRFTVLTPAAPKATATAASAPRGGGTGAGRPAANAPQPFVTPEGKRVVGPVTIWLKANVAADRLASAGLLKADGSLKGSGSVVAAAAVKAGILVESPVPVTDSLPASEAPAPAPANG